LRVEFILIQDKAKAGIVGGLMRKAIGWIKVNERGGPFASSMCRTIWSVPASVKMPACTAGKGMLFATSAKCRYHPHMSSIDLACLPPAVAESPAAGKAAAVKKGRRTVARMGPTAPVARRSSRRRMTVEEWIAEYGDNRPSVPGAVDAFIRERE